MLGQIVSPSFWLLSYPSELEIWNTMLDIDEVDWLESVGLSSCPLTIQPVTTERRIGEQEMLIWRPWGEEMTFEVNVFPSSRPWEVCTFFIDQINSFGRIWDLPVMIFEICSMMSCDKGSRTETWWSNNNSEQDWDGKGQQSHELRSATLSNPMCMHQIFPKLEVEKMLEDPNGFCQTHPPTNTE